MSDNLEIIKKAIQSSDLSDEEKREFSDILVGVKDDELSPMAGLFAEDLLWVRLLFDNYKAKRIAFANHDKEAAEKILKEEKEILQKIEE